MTDTTLTDATAAAGRAAHDLALGALIGGNLFGRVAMHPALTEVSDATQRGQVLNRAWRRYGTVNSLSLLTLVGSWLLARRSEARAMSGREANLVRAKDLAMGAVAVTGLASATSGVGFAQQGAVPMTSGREPAPEAPPRAARIKRVVNALSALHLGAAIVLLAVNATLSQLGFRRPPARRTLRGLL